jgi:hypothetical protein
MSPNSIHPELVAARKFIYDPCRYLFSQLAEEKESLEYASYTFNLNKLSVKFRAAKITPTKTGQFVTLWKRNAAGITQPCDISDDVHLYVISVRKNNLYGHFVFPKIALTRQGILSSLEKEGKRGFRVYPPWDKTTNAQAQKTQKWQLDFFLEVHNGNSLNHERADHLYFLKAQQENKTISPVL